MKRLLISMLLLSAACDRVLDDSHFDEPLVASILPAEGPTSGGFQVAIGGHLCRKPEITIDGVRPLSIYSADPKEVVMTFPPHAIGDAPVRIVCDGQEVRNPWPPFRYYAANVALQTALIAPSADRVLGFADFDGDGIDDMAGMFFADGALKIFPGTSSNAFLSDPMFVFDGLSAKDSYATLDLDAQDRDGDGRADITLLETTGDQKIVERLFAHSSDQFQQRDLLRLDAHTVIVGYGSADLDGDGLPDIVAADASTLVVYRTGAAVGAPPVVVPWSFDISAIKSIARDLNGDGVEDLVLGPGNARAELLYILGSTDGNFTSTSTAWPERGELIDADGDLWPDVVSWQDDQLAVRHGTGVATFAAPVTTSVFCNNCFQGWDRHALGAFDLDENGVRELVLEDGQQFAWIDLDTWDVVVVDSGHFLGAARFGPTALPTFIYEKNTVVKSAHAIDPASPNLIKIGFRPTPPLIASQNWSCFGDVGGRDVVFARLHGPTNKIVMREREPDQKGFGAERELELSGDVEPLFMIPPSKCEHAYFGDDLGDFVIWSDSNWPPQIVRFKAAGSAEVVAFPGSWERLPARPELWIVGRPNERAPNTIARVTGDFSADIVEIYDLIDGTFQIKESGLLTPPDAARAAEYALIDDDDIVDAIYAGRHGATVLYGVRGAGAQLTFDSRPLDEALDQAVNARLVDLDSDGVWELAVETELAPKQVVLFENMHGTFIRAAAIDRIFDMRVLASCDLDGDLENDLLFNFEGAIGYMRALEDGTYGELEVFDDGASQWTPVPSRNICRDIDGDGLEDLILPDDKLGSIHLLRNASR